MNEQRDETRPPGCPAQAQPCKFRAHGDNDVSQMTCETCGNKRIWLCDALNAMFARLEAAEKR